jgi:hypothetical protein
MAIPLNEQNMETGEIITDAPYSSGKYWSMDFVLMMLTLFQYYKILAMHIIRQFLC